MEWTVCNGSYIMHRFFAFDYIILLSFQFSTSGWDVFVFAQSLSNNFYEFLVVVFTCIHCYPV